MGAIRRVIHDSEASASNYWNNSGYKSMVKILTLLSWITVCVDIAEIFHTIVALLLEMPDICGIEMSS